MCDYLTRARFVRSQCPREFEASRYCHGCDPPNVNDPSVYLSSFLQIHIFSFPHSLVYERGAYVMA